MAMITPRHRGTDRAAWIAGVALLVVLALLGGASRNDIVAQPIVQLCAIAIGAFALTRPPSPAAPRVPALAWLIGALGIVMAAQLVPLPPALWRHLPGHDVEVAVSDAVALGGIWRPLSIVPDNTLSALLGIVVPAATVIVLTRIPHRLMERVMWMIVAVGALNILVALGQVATGDGPLFFYRDTAGTVTGLFHNRNHAAIFLATLPPVFAFVALRMRDRLNRYEPLWAGFALALALDGFAILLTGSRIGAVIFVVTLLGAGAMVVTTPPRKRARVSRPMPAATRGAMIAGIAVVCVALVTMIAYRDNTSLTRLEATSIEEEGRIGLWQPLLELAGRYFPFGSGFGTFDRAYRMVEPPTKLRLSYLNHAHNDYLELLLEAGIFGMVLLAVAILIGARAAIAAWRTRGPFSTERDLARVGAIVALGLMLGSISDYPLRTPMLAGWMTLALVLLTARGAASPPGDDGARGI
jgi:O-antigen ligase